MEIKIKKVVNVKRVVNAGCAFTTLFILETNSL